MLDHESLARSLNMKIVIEQRTKLSLKEDSQILLSVSTASKFHILKTIIMIFYQILFPKNFIRSGLVAPS